MQKISIHAIPKDVESFLNISLAGWDHRKPQHVLFLYSEGKIDGEKLAAFRSVIEGCLAKLAQPPAPPTAAAQDVGVVAPVSAATP